VKTSQQGGVPDAPETRPGDLRRSVALRAPERRVARSASPDLSDRALIRAAEQNRSSRSPSALASKLASPIPNRSTRR